MSKLTKLLFHPVRFFEDAKKKKQGLLPLIKSEFKSNEKNSVKASCNFSKVNFFLPSTLMLHTGEGPAGKAHLKLWIPHFISSNVKFIIVVRNIDLYEWVINEYPWLQVAFVTNPLQVEELVKKMIFLKTIFYPSNTGNNIHLLRFNHLTHVFIGHGDSEKSASAHKFFRVYDEIWTAGQAHIDRFSNAGIDTAHINFTKVGRPNLSEVVKKTNGDWRNRIGNFSILYLPTWEGVYEEQNYSSLPYSTYFLTKIQEKFDASISVKLHPHTGNRDKTLKNISDEINKAFVQNGASVKIENVLTPVDDLLGLSNIYICDISAVVTECLAANSPIFVYIPNKENLKLSSSSMAYQEYAYVFSSVNELLDLMESVLNGNDYLVEGRKKAKDYFVGTQETLNREFCKKLKCLEKNNLKKASESMKLGVEVDDE